LRPGELPEEALDAVLALAGTSRARVTSYATGEAEAVLPAGLPDRRFDHHLAHAAAAYLTSPFDDAAVLVCDQHSRPQVTVWHGHGGQLVNTKWSWPGDGFAAIYSECATLFGLEAGQEHRLEALARLHPGEDPAPEIASCFSYADGHLQIARDWKTRIARCLGVNGPAWPLSVGAGVAATFQRELGKHLVSFLTDVRTTSGLPSVCLGGGFFFNTYFNSLVSRSGLFHRTFVAPNPGNAGIAAGTALMVERSQQPVAPEEVSPFLGPGYDLEEIKATLDNCKLSYECLSEGQIIDAAVATLVRGQLVGWFQGRMEWGHRTLGNRSILASPLSPFVLDNLNLYLKKRNRHRAYGLSVSEEDVCRFFDGPPRSRWMEYDYQLREERPFINVLPTGAQTLRIQTVGRDSERFRLLHKAFEAATGVPVLVNTSFNGFSEPIVCSPRDAIRVFFGTGLDLLVLGRFVIRK
jgi:carbamoyltransferase